MFFVQMWNGGLRGHRDSPIGSIIQMGKLRLREGLTSCKGSEQAQDGTEAVSVAFFQKIVFSVLTWPLMCL